MVAITDQKTHLTELRVAFTLEPGAVGLLPGEALIHILEALAS